MNRPLSTLLVANHDSFTYNLYQLLGEQQADECARPVRVNAFETANLKRVT
ncbi:hypothetical protein [Streptomyces sp. DG1A-41]|uniref:hypothetical protein n=1 Tax=Streptomyces sp. DG1A-41 TaxID=3125779 RepID=UPI0030D258E0